MPAPRTASQILEDEYLLLRSKLLDLAAGLDRIDNATGDTTANPERERLHQALHLLLTGPANRAERVQKLMSRPYEPDWASRMGVALREESR